MYLKACILAVFETIWNCRKRWKYENKDTYACNM